MNTCPSDSLAAAAPLRGIEGGVRPGLSGGSGVTQRAVELPRGAPQTSLDVSCRCHVSPLVTPPGGEAASSAALRAGCRVAEDASNFP